MKIVILTNKNLGIAPNDTMDGIGEKRARSEDFDEISSYSVLTTLKISSRDLKENTHLLDSSVAPVKLELANGGYLEKNGDFYIVHDVNGISFIIRKLGDERLDVREARTSRGFTAFVHTKTQPHISFSYVDIDRNSDSIKVESINDKMHNPKALEDLFRQSYLKW